MDVAAPPLESHLARFKLTSFRPGQREVIAAVLGGHDCLCIMPTGGGKSLCYQLPAVAREGLTLVVSPLIALMKDQVDAPARSWASRPRSSTARSRPREAFRPDGRRWPPAVRPGLYRSRAAAQLAVPREAASDASCSCWRSMRPTASASGGTIFAPTMPASAASASGWAIRRRSPSRPPPRRTSAATSPSSSSSASRKIFITGFARPNLHFEVQPGAAASSTSDRTLIDFLRETPGAGIIYCATRKRCEELVADRCAAAAGRQVGLYHAGLEPDDRRRVQDDFMSGRTPIIVATNAFGMGIDKADLRFVVHYNIPGTLEAYYQEAGRAGRDGLPSRCLLALCPPSDRRIQEFFIESAYPEPEIVAAGL